MRVAFAAAAFLPGALAADALAPFRTDPLEEARRWQRLEDLEGLNLVMAGFDARGRMHLTAGRNSILVYDGTEIVPQAWPSGPEEPAVSAIASLPDGRLVVATTEGISLLDGTVVRRLAPHGMPRRTYRNILPTAPDVWWVGTAAGVVRLDFGSSEPSSTLVPTPHPVLSLAEGPDRTSLWVSLAPHGEVWEIPLDGGRAAPSAEWIRRREGLAFEVLGTNLLRTAAGRIWYINDNHLLAGDVYDPASRRWTSFNLNEIGGDNFDFSILETEDGTILIASRGTLHAWRNGRWRIYRSPDHPLPAARSQLLQDATGNVYLLEMGGTALRIDYGQQGGVTYENLHYQGSTPAGERVFLSADGEVLLVSADGERAVRHAPELTGMDSPVAARVTRDGAVFLVGGDGGVAAVSILENEAWTPFLFPEFARSIGPFGVIERHDGEVWVGGAQEQPEFPELEGGIAAFRRDASGDWRVRRLVPPEVPFRNWCLLEAADRSIYVAGNGLFRIGGGRLAEVTLPAPARNKWIDQITVTDDGDLWTGIWSVGVLRLHRGNWTLEGASEGLADPLVSKVLAPPGQPPLAMTREGLFRRTDGRWSPYLSSAGGLHRESGHLVADADGSIWVNRTHVDWYYRGQRPDAYSAEKMAGFRTTQHRPDAQPPQTYWEQPPPEFSREVPPTLVVAGRDAWSATPADRLEFSFRVDGGDWSPFERRRRLPLDLRGGGTHVVEVRARDGDHNVDPTPLRAEFTILIPLWRQPGFLALCAGLIALAGIVTTVFIRQRMRHLLELEAVKMRFFTEISHELKTPLSLILGPVERLQSEIRDSEHQHYLSLIKSNSQRLLHLVNQLLDFRKLQMRQVEYRAEVADLLPFARSCLTVFEVWTAGKKQDLAFETDLERLVFAHDPEVFHKILDNLVNNAVKYTPEGGRIRVRIRRLPPVDGATARGVLEVEDDGPGVPAAEQATIFEPFHRGSGVEAIEGSGIGLALVAELARAIGGSVRLVSPSQPRGAPRPGARFVVEFPLEREGEALSRPAPPDTVADGPAMGVEAGESTGDEPERSLVLVVEDNAELRGFIAAELGRDFRVEVAVSGEEGLARARELVPDLVISDIVMPGGSGIELARELKRSTATSHVPVVLLTALRSDEHKRRAYESGADDFLTKPVSPDLLRLKARNLLETHRRTRERVRSQFVEERRISGLAEADQAFVDKADAIVEKLLGEEGFDVVVLAQKMGFSRSAFYRKFQGITGVSPAVYIKTKRLRRAAQLLASGTRTVTETAFDVGFSDSGYFSRVFKEEYGCSPSEFTKSGPPAEPKAR